MKTLRIEKTTDNVKNIKGLIEGINEATSKLYQMYSDIDTLALLNNQIIEDNLTNEQLQELEVTKKQIGRTEYIKLSGGYISNEIQSFTDINYKTGSLDKIDILRILNYGYLNSVELGQVECYYNDNNELTISEILESGDFTSSEDIEVFLNKVYNIIINEFIDTKEVIDIIYNEIDNINKAIEINEMLV